jgi:hypothetical protein
VLRIRVFWYVTLDVEQDPDVFVFQGLSTRTRRILGLLKPSKMKTSLSFARSGTTRRTTRRHIAHLNPQIQEVFSVPQDPQNITLTTTTINTPSKVLTSAESTWTT